MSINKTIDMAYDYRPLAQSLDAERKSLKEDYVIRC